MYVEDTLATVMQSEPFMGKMALQLHLVVGVLLIGLLPADIQAARCIFHEEHHLTPTAYVEEHPADLHARY